MSSLTHPLVSVAMCTYNGARYLREQLDSILQQTYPNLELVIMDDASGDQTVAIIREYEQKDARIRYQVNAGNLGYNRNFEKAILLCRGDIIAVSDQDDIWESRKLEIMMQKWPEGSDFIFSLSGIFHENDIAGRTEAPAVRYHDIRDTHHLVFNSPVHGHAVMFRKEIVKPCLPFPPNVFYDWWISMHAASLGSIGCVPETLTWHRVHTKNSSRNLTTIEDRAEREKQLREQCAFFIESFMKRPWAKPDEKRSLLEYARILRTMNGRTFSWKMFGYAWKNRRKIFHYKQKPLVIFSHLKHAFRMGYKGLL
jgi:glycosyltransferase involved in cell wall biosynthesis